MLGLTAASGPWCGAVVGVRLDTAAYAAALDATAELGQTHDHTHTRRHMKHALHGVCLRGVVCGRAGEGSEAVGLLEGIKAEGLRMATHMYDTAARACSR